MYIYIYTHIYYFLHRTSLYVLELKENNKYFIFYNFLTVHLVMILGKWPTWRTVLSYVFISIPTCFEQLRAHHQENQLYQYNIWYMSLCVGDCFLCSSERNFPNCTRNCVSSCSFTKNQYIYIFFFLVKHNNSLLLTYWQQVSVIRPLSGHLYIKFKTVYTYWILISCRMGQKYKTFAVFETSECCRAHSV
jgi:hypothetical protein